MMNYTKQKKVVKYKRYISIIKACKLIRIRDKSFLGFNSMIYGGKKIMTKIERKIIHDKTAPYIITAMQHPLKNKKERLI